MNGVNIILCFIMYVWAYVCLCACRLYDVYIYISLWIRKHAELRVSNSSVIKVAPRIFSLCEVLIFIDSATFVACPYCAEWAQMTWVVSNIYLTKTKQHTEINLTPLEGEFQGDRPDDGGSKNLWNVGKVLPAYTAQQPRRQPSAFSVFKPMWSVIHNKEQTVQI
jgi:hypothetical protein